MAHPPQALQALRRPRLPWRPLRWSELASSRPRDRCVCELEAVLDESQPSISHHLKILENVGLIRGWKKGKFTHYDLIEEQIKSYLNLINQELV